MKTIFRMHNKPDLPGTIGGKSEGLMASVDKFMITSKGVGERAGIPYHTIDLFVMASCLLNM